MSHRTQFVEKTPPPKPGWLPSVAQRCDSFSLSRLGGNAAAQFLNLHWDGRGIVVLVFKCWMEMTQLPKNMISV